MKNVLKRIAITWFLLIYSSIFIYSQTKKIDRYKEQFFTEKSVELKKEVLMKICEQHFSLSSDSLIKYINIGEQLFSKDSPEYFRLKDIHCVYLFKVGKVPKAIELADSLLQNIPLKEKFAKIKLEIANTKSAALIRNNQSKEAIENTLEVMKLAEDIKDTSIILRSYSILGWANMELMKYKDATKWLDKGCNYTNNEELLQSKSSLFSNNASSYNNIDKMDTAFYLIERALKYAKQDDNLSAISNALNIRAAMYLKKNYYAAAEIDLLEALKAREKIGDTFYVMSDMAQLSSFYASTNQTKKGIEIANQGIALAKKTKNLSKLIFLNICLAENLNRAKQTENYASTLSYIINLKDSLYQKNSDEAIAEMETKYEVQKKENIIIQQENKILRNRYTAIGSIILLIFGSFVIWLMYRNYQLVQQKKMDSAIAEEKILSFKAVRLAQENERKRIAADLHDNLGSYAAAITSNIHYLKEGSITDNEMIISQLGENTSSIVTQLSDTIWVLKNEHLPITKLADRFKSWMQRIILNYPSVKYHYEENILNDIEFTPSRILHIFLILKECVNNALKHSKCTGLKIKFISTQDLKISVEDNGKGFNEENVITGDGIENIKLRAIECGWDVEWKNLTPNGTIVTISNSTTK